ncbi:hypothetical protein I7I51_07236, partial [Histoplasma capsulatum]
MAFPEKAASRLNTQLSIQGATLINDLSIWFHAAVHHGHIYGTYLAENIENIPLEGGNTLDVQYFSMPTEHGYYNSAAKLSPATSDPSHVVGGPFRPSGSQPNPEIRRSRPYSERHMDMLPTDRDVIAERSTGSHCWREAVGYRQPNVHI